MLARFIFAFLLAAAAAIAHARIPQWSFVDLGTLGGNFTTVGALTDRGDVAGASIAPTPGMAPSEPAGLTHMYLWRNGALTDLGSPDRVGLFVSDMNEDGTIVATGLVEGGLVWRDGQWIVLAPDISLEAISNSGVIVGKRRFGVNTQAIVYTGNALLGLGTFGGKDSYALGVNDRGQVVGGTSDAQGRSHAFVWQDGIMTDLGMFDGESTGAIDINNNGLILISTKDHATGMHTPFIWDGTVLRKLISMPTKNVYARKMNERGDVVGSLERNNGLVGWVLFDGQLTILDDIPEVVAAGFHELNPSKINSRGWIAGTAKNAHGDYRGFLLIRRMLKSSAPDPFDARPAAQGPSQAAQRHGGKKGG